MNSRSENRKRLAERAGYKNIMLHRGLRRVEAFFLPSSRTLGNRSCVTQSNPIWDFRRITAVIPISRLIRGIQIMRAKVAPITNVGNNWSIRWSTSGWRPGAPDAHMPGIKQEISPYIGLSAVAVLSILGYLYRIRIVMRHRHCIEPLVQDRTSKSSRTRRFRGMKRKMPHRGDYLYDGAGLWEYIRNCQWILNSLLS